MHALGWTRPGRFDEDEVLLQRSVARYHAFLDLISRTPSTFFVPTLDIVSGSGFASSWRASYETEGISAITTS